MACIRLAFPGHDVGVLCKDWPHLERLLALVHPQRSEAAEAHMARLAAYCGRARHRLRPCAESPPAADSTRPTTAASWANSCALADLFFSTRTTARAAVRLLPRWEEIDAWRLQERGKLPVLVRGWAVSGLGIAKLTPVLNIGGPGFARVVERLLPVGRQAGTSTRPSPSSLKWPTNGLNAPSAKANTSPP